MPAAPAAPAAAAAPSTAAPAAAAPRPDDGWSDYVAATAWSLREAALPIRGFDGLVDTTIPPAAGLLLGRGPRARLGRGPAGGRRHIRPGSGGTCPARRARLPRPQLRHRGPVRERGRPRGHGPVAGLPLPRRPLRASAVRDPARDLRHRVGRERRAARPTRRAAPSAPGPWPCWPSASPGSARCGTWTRRRCAAIARSCPRTWPGAPSTWSRRTAESAATAAALEAGDLDELGRHLRRVACVVCATATRSALRPWTRWWRSPRRSPASWPPG